MDVDGVPGEALGPKAEHEVAKVHRVVWNVQVDEQFRPMKAMIPQLLVEYLKLKVPFRVLLLVHVGGDEEIFF